MAGRFELTVVHEGEVAHAIPLQEAPLHIGRAPANDLVLDDDSVSWHHAQVWVEGHAVWIRDLASRNGTFVNGDRVRRPCPVQVGDRLTVGHRVELRIRGDQLRVPSFLRAFLVEDVVTGVRLPVRSDRFHVGSGPDADLRLPDGPRRAATLQLVDDAIRLGTDDGDRVIGLGEPFEVGGRTLRVIEPPASPAPTIDRHAHDYPYRAVASSDGASGPQVVLEDPGSGQELLLTGNRGVLLYLLVVQLHHDRRDGKAGSDEGWCSDADVSVGIWGKGSAERNKLHVLVHRLRKVLEEAGFDPWFIEKRQWSLRARLGDVVVRG